MEQKQRKLQDFTGILAAIRNGNALIHLGEKLTDVTDGVIETGKPGALTVKLTIKPGKRNNRSGKIEDTHIFLDVKAAIPEHEDNLDGVFFVHRDGTLSRNDERQSDLFGAEMEIRREV